MIVSDSAPMLADAQTSGLLVVGEIPGAPVVGDTVPAGSARASGSRCAR